MINAKPEVRFGDLRDPPSAVLIIANRVLAALDDQGLRATGSRFFQEALVAADYQAFVMVVLRYVDDVDEALH
jgi:hypothetical protein